MKLTLGAKIAQLRKDKGMTQLELAEKMGVTDKAVSKWERDLSCPDISSIPTLAEVLEVSVDELMQIKKEVAEPKANIAELINTIFHAVAVAMGVAVVALTMLKQLDTATGMTMLGLGLACLALSSLQKK